MFQRSLFPVVALAFLTWTGTAVATTVTGPLTQAQFQALNGSGANYGTPSNATFPDGPFTVSSGTSASLTGGPKASSADSLLLVLSASDLSGLAGGTITLNFVDAANNSFDVVFDSGDFFATGDAGFPSNIGGIANGAVNGIKFPDAQHAGADFMFGSTLTKNAHIGDVTITSPIDLRVDIFGDSDGLIVGNAANSGAEGITGVPAPPVDVPEPGAWGMFAFGLALIGGAFSLRRRQGVRMR